jgi:hypothetical protein
VTAHSAEAARGAIYRRLGERGLECRAIDQVTPSLEDVFVAQVHGSGGAPTDD